ncbi:MAG: hypothetical protein RJA36_1915 [Pseudomonadota bacterium]|jgi:hypothetical protein
MTDTQKKKNPTGDTTPPAGQNGKTTDMAIVLLTGRGGKVPKFSPRQARAVDAMKGGEWVIREALDRIAGASNSPDLIQQLMRKFGHDAIDSERFHAIDRDGRACRPGRYRFNAIGLERLAKFEAANDSGEAAA